MEEKEIKIYPMPFEAIDDKQAWGEESWKIADLGFRDSVVSSGHMEGNTLGEIMETYLDRIVGDEVYSICGRQFPVQIKTLKLTSRQPLIVCPDDTVAMERYDSLGKLKLWYVKEAAADAKIYLGLRRDLDATEFYNDCLDGSIIESLNEVPVRKGDCYLISPGTVHCADAGVTLVEISESSDLDLRICAWGHGDAQESEMFLGEAFDFVCMNAQSPVLTPSDKLASLQQFVANRIQLSAALQISTGENNSYALYFCVHGSATLRTPKQNEAAKEMDVVNIIEGQAVLVPADVQEYYLIPSAEGAELIEILAGKYEEEQEDILPDEGEESKNLLS